MNRIYPQYTGLGLSLAISLFYKYKLFFPSNTNTSLQTWMFSHVCFVNVGYPVAFSSSLCVHNICTQTLRSLLKYSSKLPLLIWQEADLKEIQMTTSWAELEQLAWNKSTFSCFNQLTSTNLCILSCEVVHHWHVKCINSAYEGIHN